MPGIKTSEEIKSVRPLLKTTLLGLTLSLVSVTGAVVSGFGTRWDLWHFTLGFKLLGAAALCGGISSIIALLGFISGIRKGLLKNSILSFVGLSLGLIVFSVPFSWSLAAKHLPKIHDITTDTEHPPQFVGVLPLRKEASNSSDYEGPEIAVKQHEAYPDIKPLLLDVPPDKVFEKALATARALSWDIVDADRKELRIEATDTTFWFGFKDDIVIRITPLGDRVSRIDVRSVSRVGLSDIGTNAARIRKYLKKLSRHNDGIKKGGIS